MTHVTRSQAALYGALGLALAFVALPLYVVLPNHHAKEFGMPLAALGFLLLGARLFDAVIDPGLGRLADGLIDSVRQRGHWTLVWAAAWASAAIAVLGFVALFFPPGFVRSSSAIWVWMGVMLALTYAAYSMLSVLHQSWAARLGGGESQQGRIVSAREAFGLMGVVLASVLAAQAGMALAALVFAATLVCGVALWMRAPRPAVAASTATVGNTWLAWSRSRFRRLMAVFMLNGIASAVPATLFLFFVQDRLQAQAGTEGPLLAAYFLCAALSIPFWLKCVARIGLARTWLIGMVLSVAVFVWAATLGAGDLMGFWLVCVLSGAALGTDLALPSALLAGVIQREGDAQQHEGAYFGWWNFATKLNLAAAAGLSLPLLEFFGYTPGARDAGALNALVIAYCLLPCVLKCLAAAALYFGIIRSEP